MRHCTPRRIIIPKQAYLPFVRNQNPTPTKQEGQQAIRSLRDITNTVLRTFFQVLPSNYVSQISGPNYTLQYQALAEQLAKVQLALEETGLLSDVDFTRPEYLWQMIGTLVLPDTDKFPRGEFEIDGDITYRDFLKRMIALLLQGALENTQKEGLELLTDGVISILDKVDFTGMPTSGWDITDAHTFEVNVMCSTTWGSGEEGGLGTGFPDDPFTTLRNNQRILRVLKPASALYDYRHLFLEMIPQWEESWKSKFWSWYYEDFRKYCCGRKEIVSINGKTLPGKFLLSDVTLTFNNILPGATLTITSGPNTKPSLGGKDAFTLGVHRVVAVHRLRSGADPTARPYTTSPTGLSGFATVQADGSLTDPDQDFSFAVEGEIVTVESGPNAWEYRLETILGLQGGPVGFVLPGIGAKSVRVAPCLIQTKARMVEVAESQQYTCVVERLGVKVPFTVLQENLSEQFYI